jgi:hypothetical protein
MRRSAVETTSQDMATWRSSLGQASLKVETGDVLGPPNEADLQEEQRSAALLTHTSDPETLAGVRALAVGGWEAPQQCESGPITRPHLYKTAHSERNWKSGTPWDYQRRLILSTFVEPHFLHASMRCSNSSPNRIGVILVMTISAPHLEHIAESSASGGNSWAGYDVGASRRRRRDVAGLRPTAPVAHT